MQMRGGVVQRCNCTTVLYITERVAYHYALDEKDMRHERVCGDV